MPHPHRPKPAIHLDAYLHRIAYDGPRSPTVETLAALHRLHAGAIPFETLNPLLGWPVKLDPASLETKLVRERRGGWCFEQNLLFRHALEALGFRVTGLAARVLWNLPEDAVTPRGHMLLRVDLADGPWIADVGFGGQTLTGPLRLAPDVEQATPHEPFRLARAGEGFKLQSKIGDEWKTLYRFDLQEQFLPDYEVSNYFLATHPNSHFRGRLLAARSPAGRRYALLNDQLAIHHSEGTTDRRMLTTVAELKGALRDALGLHLPETPELDAALAPLVQGP